MSQPKGYRVPKINNPNSTLALQISAAKRLLETNIDTDNDRVNNALELGQLLADTILMFDKYLTDGGELPVGWKPKKKIKKVPIAVEPKVAAQ